MGSLFCGFEPFMVYDFIFFWEKTSEIIQIGRRRCSNPKIEFFSLNLDVSNPKIRFFGFLAQDMFNVDESRSWSSSYGLSFSLLNSLFLVDFFLDLLYCSNFYGYVWFLWYDFCCDFLLGLFLFSSWNCSDFFGFSFELFWFFCLNCFYFWVVLFCIVVRIL